MSLRKGGNYVGQADHKLLRWPGVLEMTALTTILSILHSNMELSNAEGLSAKTVFSE